MSEKKIKITFLRRHEVQDEHRGTSDATVYVKGRSYTLGEASALHFLSRGIAAPEADLEAKAKAEAEAKAKAG